jgi:hypothetical protein
VVGSKNKTREGRRKLLFYKLIEIAAEKINCVEKV